MVYRAFVPASKESINEINEKKERFAADVPNECEKRTCCLAIHTYNADTVLEMPFVSVLQKFVANE